MKDGVTFREYLSNTQPFPNQPGFFARQVLAFTHAWAVGDSHA